MDAATVERIAKLGAAEVAPKSFRPEAEPSHVFYLRNADGSYSREEAATPPLELGLFSLESIAEYLKRDDTVDAALFYDADAINVRLGFDSETETQYRDSASMGLEPSDQIIRIGELNSKKPIDQRSLLRTLRYDFTDNLGAAGNLIEVLTSVRFSADGQGETTIKQGSVSLGKTIRQSVTGVGELPEIVTLTVPYFGGNILPRASWVPIRMALDADPATQTFQFFPIAGELDNAKKAAVESLRARLLELGVKQQMYHGEP